MVNWIDEGHFISYNNEYFYVANKERGRFAYTYATIAGETEAAAEDIENLKPLSSDRLFQCAFGIPEGLLAYIKIPTDKARFGTDKLPEHTSSSRLIGWVDYTMSPYEEPSLDYTEFFTQKTGSLEFPRLTLYNKTKRRMRPVIFFEVNRMIITKVTHGETLEKLRKKLIPCRPIALTGLPSVAGGRG